MNIFKIFYNSFVMGLTISVLAFQNEWLEMRVNIGLIVPIIMIVSLVVYGFIKAKSDGRKKLRKINIAFTFINVMILVVVCGLVLGFKPSMTLVPAILREALGLVKISLHTINIIVIAFLIVGFSIIFRYEKRKKLIRRKGALKFEKLKKINHS